MVRVVKRDGAIVDFDINKIINAITKASKSIHEIPNSAIEIMAKSVENKIKNYDEISVETIQDEVEKVLIENNYSDIAKSYILYRDQRTKARDASSYITKTIHDLTNVNKDTDNKRENANINANSTMGTMLKYGSETAKWYNLRNVIRPKHADLHIKGIIHIHDLDFYSLCTNCTQIPLDKLFENGGFFTGHGYLRTPNSIGTAASLAAIAIQSSQNDFFGGQSIPMFDFYMAPYVKKSYIKNIISIIEIEENEEYANLVKEKLNKINKNNESLLNKDRSVVVVIHSVCRNKDLSIIEKWIKLAKKRTNRDTYQAMEGLIHNLNTLACRSGSQVPFSSINFGMDTSPEGRMVSKNLMLAQEAGLGNGETAIFPITIFSTMPGYNYNPEDPNYDLFKLSCRVSAKRLFPNWNNVGATWNKKYFKEGHPETIVSVMGILSGDEYVCVSIGEKKAQYVTIKDLINNIYKDNKYIKANNVPDTFFSEVTNLKIYDGYSWTKVKKIMKWMDCTTTKWYKITFSDKSGIIKNIVKCSYDHPWRVMINTKNKFERIKTEELKQLINNNVTCIMDNDHLWYIKSIEDIESIRIGYDFETDSDMFAVTGLPIYEPIYDLEKIFYSSAIISHNCRTRVIGNVWRPDLEVTPGRGNLSFTSINLPYLALEVNGDVDKFFIRLDEIIDDVIVQLMDRYKIQSKRKAKNFPFTIQQGATIDGDKLDPDDELGDILRNGTLSIAYVGLAECLIALTGKHHGESEEAQELGIRIISHMRKRMDDEAQKTKYNFSLIAAPAEGTCGTFAIAIKKQFGIIPGISDKDFLTNGNHVPVYYNCTVSHKVDVEAPYHELCNAGNIFYAEYDGDPLDNLEAFESIVRYAIDSDMGYISINHAVDRCPVCNYIGIIKDTCPRCGRKENEWPSKEKLLELKKIYPNIRIPNGL